MVRIFLIGYMGVGKTTAGKELARLLDLQFVDLDHFIQNRYNKTIGLLFEELGESRFREIESKVLQEVAQFENVVISTGGGTPCFYNNLEVMNQAGTTVYMKADALILSQRLNLCKEKRPLIKDKNETELFDFVTENLERREPFYCRAKVIFEAQELVNREDVGKYVQSLIDEINKNQILER